MKKSFILSCIIVIISLTHSYSQEFTLGVRGGVDFATFIGKNINDVNLKLAWHAGMFSKFDLSDGIKFQPELLLSNKGYSDRGTLAGIGFVSRQQLLYLDLPLLANISLYEKFSLLLGVQPSLLLSGKYKTKYNRNNFSAVNDKFKNTDIFKRADFGLVGGLQYEPNEKLDLGIRFVFGTPIVIKNTSNSIHNFNVMLTAGYTLGK